MKRPPEWFEKALKRIDPFTKVIFHQGSGVFELVREMNGPQPYLHRYEEVAPGVFRIKPKIIHMAWLMNKDGTPWDLEVMGSFLLTVLRAGDIYEGRARPSGEYDMENQLNEEAYREYHNAGWRKEIARTALNAITHKTLRFDYGKGGVR